MKAGMPGTMVGPIHLAVPKSRGTKTTEQHGAMMGDDLAMILMVSTDFIYC